MGSYLGRNFEQKTSRNRDRSMRRLYSHSADIDFSSRSSCSCARNKNILYESRCARNTKNKRKRAKFRVSEAEEEHATVRISRSLVPVLCEICILYNAYDDNFVSNILLPRLDNELPMILHLRRILSGQERRLNSWQGMELEDRDDCKKVAVVVLSDHYLQDIQRTSQYQKIHRCHKTLIIQVGRTTTSDVPYKLFGRICIKISWFTWPEHKDERVGFWNVFTSHIDP